MRLPNWLDGNKKAKTNFESVPALAARIVYFNTHETGDDAPRKDTLQSGPEGERDGSM